MYDETVGSMTHLQEQDVTDSVRRGDPFDLQGVGVEFLAVCQSLTRKN